MVAPALEGEVAVEEMTTQPSDDSNSGESYEVQPEDVSVSTGDIKIAVMVACASETLLGRCL